jgi:hypothetical protein
MAVFGVQFKVGEKRIDNVGVVWTVVNVHPDPDDPRLGLVTLERRPGDGTVERMPLPFSLAESMGVVKA